MTPLQFAYRGRHLTAMLHDVAPQERKTASTALLVCNPFGQEAVRVHRLQRMLCEQLARVAMPSMRFDYFGTGESMGEDEEGDIDGWVGDVMQADQVLRQRTGCRHVIWLGTRLGASLAVLAAARSDANAMPRGLVLWEPIISGPSYQQTMGEDHERSVRAGYGPLVKHVERTDRPQVIGFGLGGRLRQQLGALSLPPVPAGIIATVIAPPERVAESAVRACVAGWANRQAQVSGIRPIRLVTYEHDFDWVAEEALNTSLVPAETLRILRAEIEAVR